MIDSYMLIVFYSMELCDPLFCQLAQKAYIRLFALIAGLLVFFNTYKHIIYLTLFLFYCPMVNILCSIAMSRSMVDR